MSYKSKPGYVDNLLILRGLCSLGVLVAHATLLMPEKFLLHKFLFQDPALMQTFLGKFLFKVMPFSSGKFVFTFFVLSGYLMGKIYWNKQYEINKGSIMSFYINRFLRIAPLFYFSLIICMFLTNKFYHLFSSPLLVFGDFFFVNNITDRVINGVTWSLSYEMQDYLICPLFFLFFARKDLKTAVGLFFTVIIFAAFSFYLRQYESIKLLTLGRFTYFFLGGYAINIVVRYFHEDLKLWGNSLTKAFAFILFFATNLAYDGLANMNHEFMAEAQLLISGMIILLLLELPEKNVPKIVTNTSWGIRFVRGLTWMGTISYGIYLWHAPIINANLVTDHLLRGLTLVGDKLHIMPTIIFINLAFVGAILFQTVLLSFITFFLIELRFRPSLYNWNESVVFSSVKTRIMDFMNDLRSGRSARDADGKRN